MNRGLNIICPTYWYPESARDMRAIYVHDIVRHLVTLGHRVCVVAPAAAGVPLSDELDGVQIRRFRLELPDDLNYGKVAQGRVSAIGKLKRLLAMKDYLTGQYRAVMQAAAEFEPDVLHGHWAIPTGPAIVAAARRLRVPSVITMHGGDVYVNKAEGYDFPTRWYVRPILKWTLTNASALTAISDDCIEHALRAGAPRSQIHLIMNGADLRRFSPAPQPDSPRPYGPKMIFACRQLFPRKGIRFLISAAAKLRSRHPELKLMIAGDGFERPELERQAAELGIADVTTFLGWVANADLPQYFRACAVLVMPSLEEGFGIPAAEAMGCEAPVVATDAGGLPEVVENEVTGLIVPKGDVDAMAAAIDRVLSDPALARRMGEAGRARALARFDWMRSCEKFVELYEALIARQTAPAGQGAAS
jgi:glycogen(starch) synthase